MSSLRLSQLLALPEPERLLRARNGSWTATDVRIVADRAFAGRFGEMEKPLELALVGLAMSKSLPPTKRGNDSRARALAIYANILRMKGDFPDSRLLLDQAFSQWRRGTKDAALGAFVAELRASLWQAMSLWETAVAELDFAETLRRSKGLSCASLLIQRGLYLTHSGSPERSIAILEQALQEATTPPLIASAITNIAWVHVEAGRPSAARNALLLGKPLLERVPSGTQRTLLWIEARICDKEGLDVGAESLYRRVRASFLRAGRLQEAAISGLDLALLHARKGNLLAAMELSGSTAHLLALVGGRAEEAAARLLANTTAARVAMSVATSLEVLIPARAALRRGYAVRVAPAPQQFN